MELQSDAILAESLCAFAQTSIPMHVDKNELWDPSWKRVKAMLEGAAKLNRSEPRFSRLLTDTELRLRDTDGALAALNQTRKSDSNDQFAQVEFLDLTLGKIETVDAKLKYLKEVLGWKGTPFIPEPVRSHAGVVAAQLLIDRGEMETARKVLAEALRLNPVDVAGLRLRYQMLPANASRFERAEALMALIKANPDQMDYMAALGDQIAAEGLVGESIPWYEEAMVLSMHKGRMDTSLALRAGAEMFIAGQTADATNLVDQLTKVEPGNPLNWFLKLAVSRSAGNKDQFDKAVQQARNALSNRLVEIVDEIDGPAGGPQATTRPIESEAPYQLPDLNVAILQVNQGNPLKNDFITALFHLATLEIYFAQQPDAADKLIQALTLTLPKDNPDLTRVLGLRDLAAGKTEDARAKLLTIAAGDPLAQLGLVKITALNPAQKQMAQSMGRKLMTDYPSGVMGAILWDGMHGMKVSMVPSKEADALRQELGNFPKDWLKIFQEPQNFYQIHAEPLAIAREFSEPMLARVKITNLGDLDLTVGPDGILKQDLWFNAQVKGITDQSFAGVAFDRLAGPIVLHARQSTSQIVRLDQGELKHFMMSNPVVAMQVQGSVMTNPTEAPDGRLLSGPGGYGVKFTKAFSRSPAPAEGSGPQRVLRTIAAGEPEQKMAAINLIAAYIQIIESQKPSDDVVKGLVTPMVNAIATARTSDNPAVSAWAGYTSLELAGGDDRASVARELAADPDWRHRLIAGAALPDLSKELQREIAMELSTDTEPSVRDIGTSWLEFNALGGTMTSNAPTSMPVAHPAGPAAAPPAGPPASP
jgi:tetratricopeptide (TPR) repeat protein